MSNMLERITVNPEQCGGRPCIRGMRILVIDILDLLAVGLTAEKVLEELPDLEKEDIQAALHYAAGMLGIVRSTLRQDVNAIIMTKDNDFAAMVKRFGSPPQIIWVRCGNTSNERLIKILENVLPKAIERLQTGEKMVEINGE